MSWEKYRVAWNWERVDVFPDPKEYEKTLKGRSVDWYNAYLGKALKMTFSDVKNFVIDILTLKKWEK